MAEIIQVSKTEDGTKLLRWMLRKFPSMPQNIFFKLCRGGQIRVNSSRCKGNEFLRAGDMVRIPPTLAGYAKKIEKKDESGERFSLSDLESLRQCIIHDDDDIVVFNKPAGLAVQGGTGIKKSVDKMVAAMYPYNKISLVHRLDKETSGVLVVAKNQKAAQVLAEEFQTKQAKKEYIALLNGGVKNPVGVIDNYMVKGQVFDSPERVGGVGQRPLRAITEYKVLASFGGHLTWILFMPRTGRTHQLRMHSAFCLNAPIVGDDLYGKNKKVNPALSAVLNTNNLFLFAYRITFRHPTTGKNLTLQAKVPEFMSTVMDFLEFKL